MKFFPKQYTLQQNDVLFFSHIPKTAGMTFRTILEDQFHLDEICPASLDAQLETISPDLLQSYRLFRGHLGFTHLAKRLPNKQIIHVTWLRDPLTRLLSDYHYIRRTPHNPLYPQVSRMTLKEFVQELPLGQFGKNLQTYHVAKTAQFRLGELTPLKLLDLAKQSLDQYAFVGLVEQYQNALFLLSYIFGWKPILDRRKHNSDQDKYQINEIPVADLAVIQESIALDEALYSYAQTIFVGRFVQMIDRLLSDYAEVPQPDPTKHLCSLLNKDYEHRIIPAETPANTYVYDFNQLLSGFGWHRRECPLDSTPTYRWTGPTLVSTLDLPFVPDPNADLIIECQLRNTTLPFDILNRLTIEIFGYCAPLRRIRQQVNLFQSTIPQAVLQNAKDIKSLQQRPLTELKFQVRRIISLQDINPTNPDTRLVGIALTCVNIFPATRQQEYSLVRTVPQRDRILAGLQRMLSFLFYRMIPQKFRVRVRAKMSQILRLKTTLSNISQSPP